MSSDTTTTTETTTETAGPSNEVETSSVPGPNPSNVDQTETENKTVAEIAATTARIDGAVNRAVDFVTDAESSRTAGYLEAGTALAEAFEYCWSVGRSIDYVSKRFALEVMARTGVQIDGSKLHAAYGLRTQLGVDPDLLSRCPWKTLRLFLPFVRRELGENPRAVRFFVRKHVETNYLRDILSLACGVKFGLRTDWGNALAATADNGRPMPGTRVAKALAGLTALEYQGWFDQLGASKDEGEQKAAEAYGDKALAAYALYVGKAAEEGQTAEGFPTVPLPGWELEEVPETEEESAAPEASKETTKDATAPDRTADTVEQTIRNLAHGGSELAAQNAVALVQLSAKPEETIRAFVEGMTFTDDVADAFTLAIGERLSREGRFQKLLDIADTFETYADEARAAAEILKAKPAPVAV